MLPRTVGLAVVQLNFLINTILASRLGPGSLAALNYAWLLMLLPEGIFAQAIATAAFPTFSALAARQQHAEMRRTLASTLRAVLYLTIPASLGLFILRVPVIQLLFQRGRFDLGSTEAVAWALQFYALGLFAHATVEIVTRAFYALHDTATPVIVGVLAMGANIVLSLILVRPMGYAGLALANSLATIAEMCALILSSFGDGWGASRARPSRFRWGGSRPDRSAWAGPPGRLAGTAGPAGRAGPGDRHGAGRRSGLRGRVDGAGERARSGRCGAGPGIGAVRSSEFWKLRQSFAGAGHATTHAASRITTVAPAMATPQSNVGWVNLNSTAWRPGPTNTARNMWSAVVELLRPAVHRHLPAGIVVVRQEEEARTVGLALDRHGVVGVPPDLGGRRAPVRRPRAPVRQHSAAPARPDRPARPRAPAGRRDRAAAPAGPRP